MTGTTMTTPTLTLEMELRDCADEKEHSAYNVDLLVHLLQHKKIDRIRHEGGFLGPYWLSLDGRTRLERFTMPQAMDRLKTAKQRLSGALALARRRLDARKVRDIVNTAERFYKVQRLRRGLKNATEL